MSTLILDGTAGSPEGPALLATLTRRLPEARVIDLAVARIGNCAGHFFCWTRTPGECHTDDDNRRVAAAWAAADLVVMATPVRFGGFSADLKQALDHLIQNLTHWFTTRHGETRHRLRHPKNPNLLVLGLADGFNPEAEESFRSLVRRNGINFGAATAVAEVILGGGAALDAAVRRGLDRIQAGTSSPAGRDPLPYAGDEAATWPPLAPRRAVLVVGSPRTRTSTSQALGDYLLRALTESGIETATLQAYTQLGDSTRAETSWEALLDADLAIIAAPTYIDALPGPVTAFLERWAARPGTQRPHTPQTVVALTNCGFPEAHHGALPLALVRQFARETGRRWAGGLSLGGGEGIIHGAALTTLGGRSAFPRAALDVAADSLARGEAIPTRARELMGRSVIPDFAYRALGTIRFKRETADARKSD